MTIPAAPITAPAGNKTDRRIDLDRLAYCSPSRPLSTISSKFQRFRYRAAGSSSAVGASPLQAADLLTLMPTLWRGCMREPAK